MTLIQDLWRFLPDDDADAGDDVVSEVEAVRVRSLFDPLEAFDIVAPEDGEEAPLALYEDEEGFALEGDATIDHQLDLHELLEVQHYAFEADGEEYRLVTAGAGGPIN
jgi:hypothetical protein